MEVYLGKENSKSPYTVTDVGFKVSSKLRYSTVSPGNLLMRMSFISSTKLFFVDRIARLTGVLACDDLVMILGYTNLSNYLVQNQPHYFQAKLKKESLCSDHLGFFQFHYQLSINNQ